MTDRILIACPHCQHELRVRTEYIGRRLVCNYCREPFDARPAAPHQPDVGQAGVDPRSEKSPLASGAMAEDLERAKAKITQLRGQRQALAEEVLKAKNVLGPLRHRVKDLEGQLEHANVEKSLAEEEARGNAAALAELDRLRVEIASLGPRAADAIRLEERALELERENTHLRTEIEESREVLSRASDQDAEASGEMTRLVHERDEAARHRDQLATELESVRTGFREARDEINRMGRCLEEIAAERDRLEDERAAVSRMRDELQALINDQRRSIAAREAELNDVLERVNVERAQLESRFDEDRNRIAAEFAEYQARTEETIRRLEAELERNAQAMKATRRDHDAAVAALRQELQNERAGANGEAASLKDELAAAQTSIEDLRADRDRLVGLHEQERQRAVQAEQRLRAETDRFLGERRDALSQLEIKGRLVADLARRLKSLQDEVAQAPRAPANGQAALPARPRTTHNEEPAVYRARLQVWLDQAGEELAAAAMRAEAIRADVNAARDELDALNTDLALGAWDDDKREIAFPFEEG